MENHLGSCLCKKVKYSIEGNFEGFFFCHCTHCQKGTGSAHGANLVSTSSQIFWLQGHEQVKTFVLQNTRHTKSFCSECGSALPSIVMDGKMLVVPAGSLDSEVKTLPTAHIFYGSKANWEKDLDKIHKFEAFPS